MCVSVGVCVCFCVCVCVSVCSRASINTCKHMHVRTHVIKHQHINTHMCIYACMQLFVHWFIYAQFNSKKNAGGAGGASGQRRRQR